VISSSQARTSLADHSCLHMQVLTQGMKASVDSIQGWQLLSQLQLQNQQYDLAAESAAKGLKCLHQRQKRGYRSQPAIAAGIVLARARSLLHLGLSDDAVALFKALTGKPPYTPPTPPSSPHPTPPPQSRLPSLWKAVLPWPQLLVLFLSCRCSQNTEMLVKLHLERPGTTHKWHVCMHGKILFEWQPTQQ